MKKENKYYKFFRKYDNMTRVKRYIKLKKLSDNFDLNILVSLWNDYNKYLESNSYPLDFDFENKYFKERELNLIKSKLSDLKTYSNKCSPCVKSFDFLKNKNYDAFVFLNQNIFNELEMRIMKEQTK